MKLRMVIAKGGFLVHLKDHETPQSLCYHEPRDNWWSKMERAGWYTLDSAPAFLSQLRRYPCRRCFRRARKQFRDELAAEIKRWRAKCR